MHYLSELLEIVGATGVRGLDKKDAVAHTSEWTEEDIEPADHACLKDLAEGELLGLHESGFARYRISHSEFEAWQKISNVNVQQL